jgi:sulfite reductase (ferredoxin)
VTTPRTSSRPQRGEGQWALGYREPLNPNERMKKDSDGLEVRQRILDIYSKAGFDAIDPGDLRGRMRWMGLYTQRAQGIPGGKTALLEPEELEDSYFMLRVRIDGGQLSSDALRVIGGISTEFGRDVADVTDRQNVQLHWIRIEDVPEIWRRLGSVGLSSTEACGDVPRVMLGCPLAGILEDEVIDATDVLAETVDKYIGSPEFSNLPRKWKTSMSGCVDHCTEPEIDDVSFVGVVNAAGEAGYDLMVGGGLSTNPKFAQRIGVFVRPDQVTEVWAACTSIFRDYGYRRQRNHARIKFLMADWGPEKFRQVLQDEYLHAALPDGPAPAPAKHDQRDHVGVAKQKDGANALGFALRTGRISGSLLTRIADLADEYGAGRIRTTTQQKMVILDVPDERVEDLVAALAEHDLLVRPSAFRRGTMACTGLQAGDRRDQAARAGSLRGAGEAAARLRRADRHQRERLPEQLRAVPDRRHRLQGLDGARRQRRDGRGLPGPPRRPSRRRGDVRPEVPGSQGHQGRHGRLLRARAARLSGPARAR